MIQYLASIICTIIALVFVLRGIVLQERVRLLRHDLKSVETNRTYWRNQYGNLQNRYDAHMKYCSDLAKGGLYVAASDSPSEKLSDETEA